MKIVLVDDDDSTLAIQKRYTKKFLGVDAMTFADAEQAARYLSGRTPPISSSSTTRCRR